MGNFEQNVYQWFDLIRMSIEGLKWSLYFVGASIIISGILNYIGLVKKDRNK